MTRVSFVDKAVECSVDTLNTNREIEAVAEIPKQWHELMDRAGYASIRQLAKAAGLNHTVVNPVIMKGTTTSPDNMGKIAAVLSVPLEDLYLIKSGTRNRPLSIPKGTELLTERQKDAVAELIRSMVEERLQDATDDSFVDTQKSDPPESVPEKNGTVTALGGRTKRLPAEERFAEHQRRVARLRRNIPPHGNDTPDDAPVS